MPHDILGHMAYKIANATVNPFPMPHIFVEDVFPKDFYRDLYSSLPPEGHYAEGKASYNGRKFSDPMSDPLIAPLLEPLKTKVFAQIAMMPFMEHITKRCTDHARFKTDLRLVLDGKNYAIGPHTDAPNKVLSFLFYLPKDFNNRELGTSLYLPNDLAFRCPGGPHHKYEDFVKIATMPYFPNSLLAFFKTDFGFHGVEPITIPCRRDVLLWNLYEVADVGA